MNDLIVVGGGITGLSAAYLAARTGVKVTVVEASPTLGGLLATFPIAGNRLEWFYHHSFTHDAELTWLLRELNIEGCLEFHTGSMGVFRDGHIYSFNGPRDLIGFRPMSLLDKARFGLTSLYLARLARWQSCESVPALDWFRRYAGPGAAESLWEPLLAIKFGPYAGEIPLAWMVGRLRQRLNSRRGGKEKLGYVRGSLQVLLDALLASLRKLGARVLSHNPVQALQTSGAEITGLATGAGLLRAEAYLFTIPTTYLSELVAPVSETYAAELRQIRYFGAVCTILEMKRPLLPVYWLNIADRGYPFGGLIEHTNLVSPGEYGGRHILYLSRYFAHSDPLAVQPVPVIRRIMMDGLKRACPHLHEQDVLDTKVFSSRTAALVSGLNFSQKVPACRAPLKRMFVASMPHVYPDERSCNNSIRVAAEACRVMGIPVSVPACSSLSGKINME
jgi:protoporphyrinogen oxidase